MTDAQWEEIEPLYSRMRNRKWSKSKLINAVLYAVAVLIDSQSVKTVTDNEERGIDGEKTKGRKRHADVNTMGNLLGIVVHADNIHDTKSGIPPRPFWLLLA